MPAPAAARRSAGPLRADGIGVPPERMPLVHDGRPLKAWRYVGLYTPALMLCAGRVRVGPSGQAFWAVWDREATVLHGRTSFITPSVAVADGGLRVRGRGVRVDLALESFGDAVEVLSPHGASWIWTRKTLAAASGTVTAGGRVRPVRGTAIIDDSAGYHARDTAWEWCAGVGALADGRGVAWNLVRGVHDRPEAGESTVWVDGHAAAVAGPVAFDRSLASVRFSDGLSGLTFVAEAVRERHDHAGPLRSDYVQPFGRFTGDVPQTGPLANGFGVMERHTARW